MGVQGSKKKGKEKTTSEGTLATSSSKDDHPTTPTKDKERDKDKEKDKEKEKKKEKETLLKCESCNGQFLEKENTEGACRYHPGKVVEVKTKSGAFEPELSLKWSCCSKAVLDMVASHKVKIAVLGQKGVGKSGLITKVTTSHWLGDLEAKSNDTSMVSRYFAELNTGYHCVFELEEIPEPLPGLEEELVEHVCAFTDAQIIVLVCDSVQSLQMLKDLHEKIKTAKGDYPVVLVATKSDVCKVEEPQASEFEFAKRFVQFSAKTGSGCDDVIDEISELAELVLNNGCKMDKHKARKRW